MNNKMLQTIACALLMALLFMSLMGQMTFFIKGMEFQVVMSMFTRGETEIQVPPVGSITAKTHPVPLKIKITLNHIDIDQVQQLMEKSPSSTLLKELKEELMGVVSTYVIRLVLLAALGGMVGAILINGRQLKPVLWGSFTGLCVGLFILGLTYSTYQVDRFETPQYHGAIKYAPWAVGLAETAFQKFTIFGEHIQAITTNLSIMLERMDKIKPLQEDKDNLLVLHISDIHNNPAAYKFLQEIVKNFPVDFVLDTGDIADYGTPLEGQLLKGLKDLKIPYLFVPGNHDSPDIIKEISRYPQVQVLTGGVVDVQGLKILALADPSSTSHEIAPANNEVFAQYQGKLLQYWEEAPVKPHLAAVHNVKIAEPLLGKIPLVLYGHTHQYSIREEKQTVLVNAGSTGGEGIRGLQLKKEVPYTVVLLHFVRDEHNELYLAATDTIKLYSMEKGFSLERKIFMNKKDTGTVKEKM